MQPIWSSGQHPKVTHLAQLRESQSEPGEISVWETYIGTIYGFGGQLVVFLVVSTDSLHSPSDSLCLMGACFYLFGGLAISGTLM